MHYLLSMLDRFLILKNGNPSVMYGEITYLFVLGSISLRVVRVVIVKD
jgi:hypothetical protein